MGYSPWGRKELDMNEVIEQDLCGGLRSEICFKEFQVNPQGPRSIQKTKTSISPALLIPGKREFVLL